MANRTEDLVGPQSAWTQVAIRLDDVHGMHGGRAMRIGGEGQVEWQGTPPTCPGRQLTAQIEPSRVAGWLRRAVEADLLGCPDPPMKLRVPGEACPRFTLSGPGGEAARPCWAHDLALVPPFQELYRTLLELEKELLRQG